jgi:BirA family transcriptional regulator, biotin operon repressor / biotin---[acetyl-CoA-carboxylase] ligase
LPLKPDHPLGTPFIELQSVDSTNKYAMALVHEGMAHHGITLFAHEQTAGKGQRGKTWLSESGKNLMLSIIADPKPLTVFELFRLSICVAVATHDFLTKHAGDETSIKWPNDIYWRDRKAGGILIENVITGSQDDPGSWRWAVIGVGININQVYFPPDLPNPVSLKQITGKDFDTITLAKELSGILDSYFQQLIKGDFKSLYDGYQQVLYKKNEKVKLKKDSRVFNATIKGVTEKGQLVIDSGIEERFDFGEVEWLI